MPKEPVVARGLGLCARLSSGRGIVVLQPAGRGNLSLPNVQLWNWGQECHSVLDIASSDNISVAQDIAERQLMQTHLPDGVAQKG